MVIKGPVPNMFMVLKPMACSSVYLLAESDFTESVDFFGTTSVGELVEASVDSSDEFVSGAIFRHDASIHPQETKATKAARQVVSYIM